MIKTAEQIAQEAASSLITVEQYDPPDGDYWVCIGRSPTHSGDAHLYSNKDDAEYDASLFRRNAAPIILAAIREDRGQPVAPSPVPDAMLADIRAGMADHGSEWWDDPWEANTILFDHVAHQDAVIADQSRAIALMQNDSGQYQAGVEAGIRRAVTAAQKRMEGYATQEELDGLLAAIEAAVAGN